MEKSKDYWRGYTDALLEWHNANKEHVLQLCENIRIELEKGGYRNVKRKRVGGKYKSDRKQY